MAENALIRSSMTDNDTTAIDNQRQLARKAFLISICGDQAGLDALPADASFRRYFRVTGADKPYLLMDSPPAHENLPAYLIIAQYLRDQGLAAPDVLANDAADGFALIEDFGDQTYTRLLRDGGDEQALYGLAIDVLAALHQRSLPDPDAAIPAYDHPSLLAEAALFVDWYWEHVMGSPPTAFQYQQFMGMVGKVMTKVATRRDCLVLRDYHVDNLMLRSEHPEGSLASCGLLDFQDARIGARAYDLMSLLEDARRDVSDDLTQAMIERYTAQCPPDDQAAFEADYRALAVGRHAKVLGIFVRLNRRDGKPQYLKHLPRIARLLARALERPSMDELRGFLDAECPAWRTPKVTA